jgi:signal transduction histidine kinase
LLLLVIVRQGFVFPETARLRRESVTAHATEQALRELDRRKDEFLSVVSHELRTPLASLQGFIQLLARRLDSQRPHEASTPGAASDAGRQRNGALLQTALDYSEASVRRLTRLADDLVDDARIRHGQLDVHLEPCDLGTIVREAVEEQRALEPDRTIRLELPAVQSVPVIADADRIAQVVTNYLTNALKYSKADRPITVCLETEGDMARVSVRDEGPGISLSDQMHLFERFPQIKGAAVQSGSGISLGLGLHICKAIIEGHHGHVGVHSAPGQGSTFWFTLPLARPSA